MLQTNRHFHSDDPTQINVWEGLSLGRWGLSFCLKDDDPKQMLKWLSNHRPALPSISLTSIWYGPGPGIDHDRPARMEALRNIYR